MMNKTPKTIPKIILILYIFFISIFNLVDFSSMFSLSTIGLSYFILLSFEAKAFDLSSNFFVSKILLKYTKKMKKINNTANKKAIKKSISYRSCPMLIYKELLIDFKNLFEILNACFPTNFNNGSKKIKKIVEPIIETAIAFELLFFLYLCNNVAQWAIRITSRLTCICGLSAMSG